MWPMGGFCYFPMCSAGRQVDQPEAWQRTVDFVEDPRRSGVDWVPLVAIWVEVIGL
jgi:hypothetical protein